MKVNYISSEQYELLFQDPNLQEFYKKFSRDQSDFAFKLKENNLDDAFSRIRWFQKEEDIYIEDRGGISSRQPWSLVKDWS